MCRDDDPDTECADCDNWYHAECAVAIATDKASVERSIKTGNFKCEACLRDAQNDTYCATCGDEETGKQYDSLLLCDGCPRAYHLSCMGLKDEPTEDSWFCQQCRKDRGLDKRQFGKQSAANLTPEEVAANLAAAEKHDFCEVCQDGGRLLICDFCPRAFHPP